MTSGQASTSGTLERYAEQWRSTELAKARVQLERASTLDEVLAIVRTAARRLARADGATFVLREGPNCYYADEDAITPLWKGERFPLTSCISGWAMLNARPAVIEDIYEDERIPHEAYRPTFVASLAMVPIGPPTPVGAIGVYWATRHHASAAEVHAIEELAAAAADVLGRCVPG